jgi:polar amino acid transport system substrate-binding protein
MEALFMKNSFFPVLFLSLFTALLTIAPASGPLTAAGEIDAIKARGKLRIAVYADMPPFGYVDEKGAVRGYDVVLGHRLANDLLGDSSKAEFVLVEAANRIEAILTDKADLILANFTYTKERAAQVDFALPYMKVALGVTSPARALLTNVSQLDGKNIIVIKGTTADSYLSANYPLVNLVKFDHNAEAFKALLEGRGDGLAHDNTQLFAWVRDNPGYLTGIDFLGSLDAIAPAVKKGNAELLDFINTEIIKLTAENFFTADFNETLLPAFGAFVDPKTIIYSPDELKLPELE